LARSPYHTDHSQIAAAVTWAMIDSKRFSCMY